MPLVDCRECGKQVSQSAATCPHCGARLKASAASKFFIGLGVVIGVLVVAVVVINASIPEYKKQARRIKELCEETSAKVRVIVDCEQIYKRALAEGEAKADGARYKLPDSYYERQQQKWASAQAKEDDALKERCINNKAEIVAAFSELAKKGNWHGAGLKVYRCAELTDDSEYRALAAKAEKNTK